MGVSTGAAILGGAAISAFGAKKGADAQADATGRATAAERARLNRLLPFVQAGRSALGKFEAGLDTDYSDVLSGMQDDPFYQFQFGEGQRAIEGSAAARGVLRSGRTLRDLTEFGQGLAMQQGDKAYGRNIDRQNQLLSLIQTGVNAGGANSNLANIALAGGQARADMYTNLANTGTNALSNLLLAKQLQGGNTNWGIYG